MSEVEPCWTNPIVSLSTPRCVESAVTSNAQDLAVVFKGKKLLELQQGCGALFEMHSFVFQASLNIPADKLVNGFLTDLSFGYARSRGTRISLLADIAGSQTTLKFNFMQQARESELEALSIHRAFSAQGLQSSGGGQVGSFGPVVPYQISLLVTIHRESIDDYGHFFLDGIDVSAIVPQ